MKRFDELASWETLETGEVMDFQVFGVQRLTRRSPRTGRAGRFHVLRMPSWVNVVAMTPEDHLVMVEQFRHGTSTVTLEIPGGVVEPGEEPASAAVRELAEETGYRGDPPRLLGRVEVNPAIQDNTCFTWLVTGARPAGDPEPDEGEHLRVVTVPRTEIPRLLAAGRITHSLVVAAFHWLTIAEHGERGSAEPSKTLG